jgi:hypothetical protein
MNPDRFVVYISFDGYEEIAGPFRTWWSAEQYADQLGGLLCKLDKDPDLFVVVKEVKDPWTAVMTVTEGNAWKRDA